MQEDVERCVRAVRSKDARFDGWFFTAPPGSDAPAPGPGPAPRARHGSPGDAGAGGHRRGAGIGGVIGAPAYTGGGLVPSAARLLSSRAAPAAALPRSPATPSGLGDEGRKKGNDSGPPSAIPARSRPPPSPASPSGGSPTRAVAAPATVAPRPAPSSAITGRSSG